MNILTLTNYIFTIIFFAFLIYIADAYAQSHFDQMDQGIQSLGDATINYLGQNIEKSLEDFKAGLAIVPVSIQNNIIFSESFEGPVKIAENEYVPTIKDPRLKIETVVTGLDFPTSMAFLGPDDFLVLEKNKGDIRRIVNGNLLPGPLLDVNVSALNDRGMLGIAISKDEDSGKNVFVYFTEISPKDALGSVGNGTNKKDLYAAEEPIGNRLYRYKLMNDSLASPKLLIEIPAKISGEKSKGIHNGGKTIIGPDDNVYLIIGDIGGFITETQNVPNSIPVNATSVILRISQDGEATREILGREDPVNKFYAYGIRNSFGMDFDPVTDNLWDTENGPGYGDEINLVKPGFNSGWSAIMGLAPEGADLDLVRYGGKGKYSNPEFVWMVPVAPTALKFFNSDKFGEEYKDDIFVGDFNNGTIYHFELNNNRTSLDLDGPLEDRIANSSTELQEVTFATGFGSITDIQVGPDGYLYVISLHDSQGTPYPYNENAIGTIFRIRPWDIT